MWKNICAKRLKLENTNKKLEILLLNLERTYYGNVFCK